MDESAEALVELSAAVGAGARDRWPVLMQRACELAGGAATEEALLQSYLFLGYPAALQAISLWRSLFPLSTETDLDTSLLSWRRRGEAVLAQVYGAQYETLLSNVGALHPDLGHWMVTEGYGKVLSRPGLELRLRELCIIALLAVQHAPHQLYSHLRGALNVGASSEQVERSLEIAETYASRQCADVAKDVWRSLQARRAQADGGEV